MTNVKFAQMVVMNALLLILVQVAILDTGSTELLARNVRTIAPCAAVLLIALGVCQDSGLTQMNVPSVLAIAPNAAPLLVLSVLPDTTWMTATLAKHVVLTVINALLLLLAPFAALVSGLKTMNVLVAQAQSLDVSDAHLAQSAQLATLERFSFLVLLEPVRTVK